MTMYTQIVVGYDGKARSHEAVKGAARLAGSLDASLHVVTAVPKDLFRDLDGGPERRAVDVELAREALDVLLAEFEGLTMTNTAVKGGPASVLVAEAVRLSADVIVVGNKNVQGIGRVLGSVAEGIMHKAPCDVLVINTNETGDGQ